jgi:hypothetical protein
VISTQAGQRASDIRSANSDHSEHRFYRFFSFDMGGRIALAEDHECDNDRQAIVLGRQLLAGTNHPKIEVWLRKIRIGVLVKVAVS